MSRESELIDLGRRLAEAAEPGFFEHRTQAVLAERFRARGFQVREFPGMTGSWPRSMAHHSPPIIRPPRKYCSWLCRLLRTRMAMSVPSTT